MVAEVTSWHSYPSIYALGHRALADLFTEPVIIQEKVDGSQFSFGVFNGELRCRSKGQQIQIDAPEKMFSRAVEAVKERQHLLQDGLTYRGEYLEKPKHNALAYDRTPANHIVLFDIDMGQENAMAYYGVQEWADRLGFDVVPRFYEGLWNQGAEGLLAYLENTSFLGGQKIEGVVVKSLSLFGPDKKRLMGKFVSEAFKEVHKKTWGESNPGGKDILQIIGAQYRNESRWNKAIQHLREAGQLEGSPRDIGLLMKEVGPDVLKECGDDIRDALMKWAWPHIQRDITRGLPDWYKQKLLASQFEADDAA